LIRSPTLPRVYEIFLPCREGNQACEEIAEEFCIPDVGVWSTNSHYGTAFFDLTPSLEVVLQNFRHRGTELKMGWGLV
jgi:hypothetical protein